MEVEVDASIGLELATKKDLEEMLAELRQPYREGVLYAQSGIVPAGGLVAFRVADIPDLMKFDLRKVIVWGDAHNPSTGSVYTNAGAWGGLFHGQPGNANIADFFPYPEASTGQVLPYTHDYPKGVITWRAPDNIYFQGAGFPVGENVTCICFGELSENKRNAQQNARRNRRT